MSVVIFIVTFIVRLVVCQGWTFIVFLRVVMGNWGGGGGATQFSGK